MSKYSLNAMTGKVVEVLPLAHWNYINKVVETLKQYPQVELIWLEGSLATDTGNDASDIDLRVVFSNGVKERRGFLNAIGIKNISVDAYGFVRYLTEDGIVVDLDYYNVSNMPSTVTEKRILYNKDNKYDLPVVIERKPPTEVWPEPLPTTEELQQLVIDLAVVCAAAPSMFFTEEYDSVAFYLDLYRIECIKLLYHLHGLRYAKYYKHFSKIFDAYTLDDIFSTYPDTNVDRNLSLAPASSVLFRNIGHALDRLAGKVSGVNTDIYWTVYNRIAPMLETFE